MIALQASAAGGELTAAGFAPVDPRVVRVFVASHVRLYRDALAEILAREDRLEIVGVSGGREETRSRVAQVGPDVVLLDPVAAGSVDLIRELAELAVDVKIVVIASSEAEAEVIAYAEAGVSGFVTCEESTADLVATILRAAQSELVCSPQTAATLLRRVTSLAAQGGRPRSAFEGELTPRELDVARLLDEGLSNQEIASRLCVELSTVKHHVHHILDKLGVARRGDAVALLRGVGLLALSGCVWLG